MKVSDVTSGVSNGMMIGVGIVDKLSNNDSVSTVESDVTIPIKTDSLVENEYIGQLDGIFDQVNQFVEEQGWSKEIFMIALLSGILLLVVLFFIVSVSLANVRSKGSDLWDKK